MRKEKSTIEIYPDLLVSAYAYSKGENKEGKIYVFAGGANGLTTTPIFSYEANQTDALLGWSLSSLGDINNDGYADFIAGATGYNGTGAAMVFLGDATTIRATQAHSILNQANTQTNTQTTLAETSSTPRYNSLSESVEQNYNVLPYYAHHVQPLSQDENSVYRYVGYKAYELSDHLGNVRVTVSDLKPGLSKQASVLSYANYYAFGSEQPGRHKTNTLAYRYGFNGKEKDDEISGEGNNYTAEFWQYDSRLGRRWNTDPVVVANESPYATFRNNPIYLTDPNGDCPDCKDGKYEIQEGDNFWDLEESWGMDHGSLTDLNSDLDPKKLQVGQNIKVTLGNEDIPSNVSLNSSESLKGMDGFFQKGAEGVNKIENVSEEKFESMSKEKSWEYEMYLNNMRFAPEKARIRANSTGGLLDMKKYFLNNQSQYSTDTRNWFKTQTSVTEPATRTLYVYRGYGYNLNEFGNLLFGAAHANYGTKLKILTFGGHIYSLLSNGSLDADNEVKAVERGYNYVK